MTPANPGTMMTTLIQAEKITPQTGQEFIIFTCGHQLCKVSIHILLAYPEQFQHVILRLGGMHMLMSFVVCIVAEELLRRIVQDNNMASYDELILFLDDVASSRTAKLSM